LETGAYIWTFFIAVSYIYFSFIAIKDYGKLESSKIIYEIAKEKSAKGGRTLESTQLFIQREQKAKEEFNKYRESQDLVFNSIHTLRILTILSGIIIGSYSYFS